MIAAPAASAIYRGWVRHRRYHPHEHQFRYRCSWLYLDLDDIDTVFRDFWLWSVNRRNLGEFRRSDYLGDAHQPLGAAVVQRVQQVTGELPSGPIRLLTQPRLYGYCFNPVSFYYCFASNGQELEYIVAEITNTPWKERHSYVLPVAGAQRHGSALAWDFDKAFHVSPFMPMQRRYHWRFQVPEQNLRVHMDVLDERRRDFDSTVVLQRYPLDARGLARCLAAFPGSSALTVARIHWQAFLIWCKRNPVYDHPAKSKTN